MNRLTSYSEFIEPSYSTHLGTHEHEDFLGLVRLGTSNSIEDGGMLIFHRAASFKMTQTIQDAQQYPLREAIY